MIVTIKDRCCLCYAPLTVTLGRFGLQGNYCPSCSGDCARIGNRLYNKTISEILTGQIAKKREANLSIYGLPRKIEININNDVYHQMVYSKK